MIMSSSNSTTTTSNSTASVHPTLPPLYFAQRGAPLAAATHHKNNTHDNDDNVFFVVELPPEILQTILSSYATWGDLAKLATVQQSWAGLLSDAAAMSTEARWELAQSLLHGRNGLQANPALALQHLQELAAVKVDEQGLPCKTTLEEEEEQQQRVPYFAPAMREIAECYLDGRGVAQQSGTHGIAWMAAAFEFGNDVTAAHKLGIMYERDYTQYAGVDVDVYAAATWFESAAEAGHVESMAELGLCYELGCGKEQSDEKALDWYMKAAEEGNLTAKFSVAEAFEEARGVPQSDEEACLWYYKAAVDGCVDSKVALRRLQDIARIVVPGVGQLFDA